MPKAGAKSLNPPLMPMKKPDSKPRKKATAPAKPKSETPIDEEPYGGAFMNLCLKAIDEPDTLILPEGIHGPPDPENLHVLHQTRGFRKPPNYDPFCYELGTRQGMSWAIGCIATVMRRAARRSMDGWPSSLDREEEATFRLLADAAALFLQSMPGPSCLKHRLKVIYYSEHSPFTKRWEQMKTSTKSEYPFIDDFVRHLHGVALKRHPRQMEKYRWIDDFDALWDGVLEKLGEKEWEHWTREENIRFYYDAAVEPKRLTDGWGKGKWPETVKTAYEWMLKKAETFTP
jgi:hypothetical protein